MGVRTNSITAHIDEYSVSTRVRQLRSEHLRNSRDPITIVVVEGEIVDPLIYQGLFDISRCQIVTAFGKKNAIGTITILRKEGFQGVLAIVDDDFDTLNNAKIQIENIISTDTHDIESLIINSSALDKYLLYLLPQDKHKFHAYFTQEVRKVIVDLAIPIGYIRWHFNCLHVQIDFSEINFRNFIEVRSRKINIKIVVSEVLSKNKDSLVKEDDLYNHVQEKLKNDKNEWWLVCQGHDLVKIMFMLLPLILADYAPKDKGEQKKYFENIQPMMDTENRIVKHLAMCYEKSEFEKTVMYSRISDWEKKNVPYAVMLH